MSFGVEVFILIWDVIDMKRQELYCVNLDG